jgi:pimeloyl-ACP methyl ester carboxylesterase
VIVDAGGVPVHVLERGADEVDAPTMVLLHGLAADHRLMEAPFETTLERRTAWRRLYLDLPGMGRTPGDRVASTDDVFSVVRDTVDALVPGPYAVVGQSYGGYLARGLAAAHRDRIEGVALLCPVIVPRHSERDVPAHRTLVRDPALVAAVGSEALDADVVGVIQTAETWRRAAEEVLPGEAAADAATILEVPTLILAGRQDSSTGYRDTWRILEHYPRATFAVLDRAGHALQIEQPALLDALVEEWLDRVEEQRG